jgi:glyoxylase-like metal-dependent hydrolase (beta-lactamase superfamily II)
MCQYALIGEERTLLLDTGLAETPERVIGPYLESVGSSLEAIDDVVITHADVDHCGGNHLLRRRNPSARLSCHELGGDAPIDVGLRGGETLRLSADWRVEILHLPGHTPGHLGVWDPRSGTLIIVDAVLQDGIYDRAGNRLIPPRYYDLEAYRKTIRRLKALGPDLLLTAHYPVLDTAGARDFLDRSLEFTHELGEAVREGLGRGVADLWELTRFADERVGPFPEFMHELGASVRAHMGAVGA